MATRAGISKDAVVRAAAQLADAKGWDALTLAGVAARLKIKSPSLYNHVGGMAGLRRELKLLAIRELGAALARATVGKARAAAVRGLAAAYRDFVQRHPGLYAAAIVPAARGDRELRAAEDELVATCLAVLGDYGFSRREGIHAVRAMRSAVHGFAALESAGGFGIPLDVDESFEWLVATLLRGIESRAGRASQRTPRSSSVTG